MIVAKALPMDELLTINPTRISPVCPIGFVIKFQTLVAVPRESIKYANNLRILNTLTAIKSKIDGKAKFMKCITHKFNFIISTRSTISSLMFTHSVHSVTYIMNIDTEPAQINYVDFTTHITSWILVIIAPNSASLLWFYAPNRITFFNYGFLYSTWLFW